MRKKGQVALEFVLLVVFGFVIISLIMYGIGFYVVDLKNQQQQQEINDLAQSILDSFTIAQQSTNGFQREIIIREDIMTRFNVSLNNQTRYLILQDIYGTNPNEKYYFVIENTFNFTFNEDPVTNEGILVIYNNNQPQHEGLDIVS